MTPIQIALQSTGGPQVQAVLRNIAADAKDLGAQLLNDAKAATQFANALKKTGGGANWGPAISAAQKHAASLRDSAAAARQVARAAKQAGDDSAAGINKANSAATGFIGTLRTMNSALGRVKSQKLDNLKDTFSQGRNVGIGMAAVGGAGVALSTKSALDAGEYLRIRDSLRKALGKDAGDDFLRTLENSDAAKVFGLKAILQQGQSAIVTGGFSPQELLNKQNTGLFQTMGAMAAAGGGKAEGVVEAMRQVGQVKRKGRAEKNDLDVIAESGGIDIYGLIESKFSKERLTEVMDGKKPLTYAELEQALASVPEYKGGQFKDTLGDASKGLPGQVKALEGAVFALSADVGQTFVPAVSLATTTVTGAADAFRGLHPAVKTSVAGIYGLGSLLLTVGGGALGMLNGAAEATTSLIDLRRNIRTLAPHAATAAQYLKLHLLPALGTIALGVGLVAVAAAGAYIAFKGSADAAKMSDAELKKTWPTMSKIWLGLGKAFDWLSEKVDWIRGKLGLSTDKSRDDGIERGLYEAEIKRRKNGKHEGADETFESWKSKRDAKAKGISDADESTTAGNVAKEKAISADAAAAAAGKPLEIPGAADLTKSLDNLADKVNGAGNAGNAGNSGLNVLSSESTPLLNGGEAGAGVDYTSQIRSLEDQIAAAKGKENTARREGLQAQLKHLRRAQQDARKAEGEARKAGRDAFKGTEQDEDIRRAESDSSKELLVARIEEEGNVRSAEEERSLKAELQRIEDLKDSKKLTSEAAEKQADKLREVYKRRGELREAEQAMRVAQIESESLILRSQIEAENQIGKEREKTLRLGLLASQTILGKAQLHLDSARKLSAMAAADSAKEAAGPKRAPSAADQFAKIGNLQNSARVEGLMAEAAKTKDPAEQAYLLRQATRLMDSTSRADGFRNSQEMGASMRPINRGGGLSKAHLESMANGGAVGSYPGGGSSISIGANSAEASALYNQANNSPGGTATAGVRSAGIEGNDLVIQVETIRVPMSQFESRFVTRREVASAGRGGLSR
jgi:hypothetical protein